MIALAYMPRVKRSFGASHLRIIGLNLGTRADEESPGSEGQRSG